MNKTLKTARNIFLEGFIFGIIIEILFPSMSSSMLTILVALLVLFYEFTPKPIFKLNK